MNTVYEHTHTYLFFFASAILLMSCGTNQSSDNQDTWDKFPVVATKVKTSPDNTVVTCDYSLLKDTVDIALSTLLSDFEVVCLSNEDKALVAEGNIAVSDNYIGIYSSRSGEYKLFDKKGNFISNISSRGQGANEYHSSIYDSYIDESAGRVYLLPMMSDKIIVYNLNDKSYTSIRLAYRALKGKFVIDEAKKELTVVVLAFSDTPSVLWRQDFNGTVLQEVPAAPYAVKRPDFSNEVNSGLNTSQIDFCLFLWDSAADTLYNYSADHNRMNPVFTVSFANKIPQHEYIELSNHYLMRLVEGETENYPLAMVDKHNLKGSFVRLKLDFLGNLQGASWIYFNRGNYIVNNYAYALKEKIEAALSHPDALDAQSLERLNLINEHITDDSNNILFIGKLRNTIVSDLKGNETNVRIYTPLTQAVKTTSQLMEGEDTTIYNFKDFIELKKIKSLPYKADVYEYHLANNKYKDWNAADKRDAIIGCVVEKDGTTSNVTLKKSSGIDSLDQEAIRLIRNMTGIRPATNQKDQPIRAGETVFNVFFPAREYR